MHTILPAAACGGHANAAVFNDNVVLMRPAYDIDGLILIETVCTKQFAFRNDLQFLAGCIVKRKKPGQEKPCGNQGNG